MLWLICRHPILPVECALSADTQLFPSNAPYSTCVALDHHIDNYVHDNGDAGMALMESFNADVSNNVFDDNKYGVRLSVGCADNVFSNNDITGSSK